MSENTRYLEINPDFNTWVKSLPAKNWALYDISSARIGWEAAVKSQRASDKLRLDDEAKEVKDDVPEVSSGGPTYYVQHPDGSHSIADPQPRLIL